MEDNLLHWMPTDLNVNLTLKHTFVATSRLQFDLTTGHLPHKINHHSTQKKKDRDTLSEEGVGIRRAQGRIFLHCEILSC